MRISHKYKFVFLSKWKCASESVRMALNEYTDITSTQEYPYYHHTTARDLKSHFDEEDWNWDEYYSFITVRNPWSMLVSLYYYGLPDSEGKYFWNRHWDEIVKDVYRPEQRVVPDDIIEFNRWIETYDLTPFTLDTFINDSDGKRLVTDVFPIEQLDKASEVINRKLDLAEPINIPFINKTKHPRGNVLYNAKSIEKVAEVFSSDVKEGGYKPPKAKGKSTPTFTRVKKHSLGSLLLSERGTMLKAHNEKLVLFQNVSHRRSLLEKEVTFCRKQIEDGEQQLAAVRDEFASTKQQLFSVRDELASTKQQLVSVSDELTAAKLEIEENGHIRDELSKVREELEAVRNELKKVQADRTKLTKELNEFRSNLSAERMMHTRAQAMLESYEVKLDDERMMHTRAQAMLESYEAKLDDERVLQAKLRSELSVLQHDFSIQKKGLADLDAILESKKAEIGQLHNALNRSKEYSKRLELTKADLESKLDLKCVELRNANLERRNLSIAMHMWASKARKSLLGRWFVPKHPLPKIRS